MLSLLWKCLNSSRTLSQLHGCKQKANYYVCFIFWWVRFCWTNQFLMGTQMCSPAPHGLSSMFLMCLLPSESLNLHNSHCLDALITCILQEWNQPVSAQCHCSGTQWWEVEMPARLQWLFLILLVSQGKRITLGSMLRFFFSSNTWLLCEQMVFWWKWDIVRTFLRKFPLPLSFGITSKLKEFPVEGLEKWFNGELWLPVQRTVIQFPEPYSGYNYL